METAVTTERDRLRQALEDAKKRLLASEETLGARRRSCNAFAIEMAEMDVAQDRDEIARIEARLAETVS